MKLNKREIGIISLIAVILAVFIGSKINFSNRGCNNDFEKIESAENINTNNKEENENIYVHVCGQVKNPGLIILSSNSRVSDAIEMAGGTAENADLNSINLAKKLKDEDRIYIPEIGEDKGVDSCVNSSENSTEGGLININTANSDELQQLPGIGPKMAENIIKYRENQDFKDIEDLKNVKGIGDKKFRDLENFICIN